jgi:hypothetical protein
MPPHTRTPDELRKASNHLHYEWTMFNATAEKLAQPGLDDVTRNAFIESFAIHARIFMAFLFEAGSKNPEDVLAKHFFSDQSVYEGKLETNKIKAPDQFKINSRVGKEVAHLSYKRQQVTPEMKTWEISAIRDAIIPAMETFLACVPNELLGDRWDDYKKRGFQYATPAPYLPAQGQSAPHISVGTAPPATIANTFTPGTLRPHKPDDLLK